MAGGSNCNDSKTFASFQNGRDLPRKLPTDKKSKEIDEMLKEVLTAIIPEAPLDGIGATPRNNDMGKTFNPNDMHGPPKHKVKINFYIWNFLELKELPRTKIFFPRIQTQLSLSSLSIIF